MAPRAGVHRRLTFPQRLHQENAALKKGTARRVTMKVSEKGALSGRFSLTLDTEWRDA